MMSYGHIERLFYEPVTLVVKELIFRVQSGRYCAVHSPQSHMAFMTQEVSDEVGIDPTRQQAVIGHLSKCLTCV